MLNAANSNSLLTLSHRSLPSFAEIKANDIEPAIRQILAENRLRLKKILQQQPPYTWDNLMQPLEELDDRLNYVWATVGHLNGVMNTDAIRDAYNICLPLITEYATDISHNKALYQAIKALAESDAWSALDLAQQKIISNELRDFHLAGINLSPLEKRRFRYLQQRLSKLMNKFEENLLDATEGWVRLVIDPDELTGLPDYAIAAAKELAEQQQLSGWLFSLDLPSYLSIMTYADSATLRAEMYHAYVTRASEQNPNGGRWDNSQIMQQILQTRHEIALLLGYQNYAELSLATKTAQSTSEVINFLQELAKYSLPKAQKEYQELQDFAHSQYGVKQLQPWDIIYYSEKLRQHQFSVSDEILRPYFPVDQVLQGMFDIVERLFGMTITASNDAPVWHEDVRFFRLYDQQHQLRGEFYLDLYARQHKRGGAWMEEGRSRRRLANGQIQTPITYLNCNFSRPVGNEPALLTHDDVLTLLHEFGHGLQHLLTQIDHAPVSGTNGVPWDCVEFPSQFMENWAWEKEALRLLTRHYQTGETLPDNLFQQLRQSKQFQAGMQMVRQLEFGLFDFRLHMEFDPNASQQIQSILDQVRAQLAVYPVPHYNRFQHSFSHIFGSSYGAGYYSYKWAEVLASDAFEKFAESNIFDRATGELFLKTILEQGGAQDPIKLFVDFRGRKPSIASLLKHMDRYLLDTQEGRERAFDAED